MTEPNAPPAENAPVASPPPNQAALPILAPPAYFNGFGIVSGTTDITIVLNNGLLAVGAIQSTPAVLKQLSHALADAIEKVESVTGISYPPLMELNERAARK